LDRRNGDRIGTVFFDEISELDASFQRRVLQLIPDGNGLGDASPFATRIICCTARDLESEVRGGRFRGELYYRLNGVCLRLPPLRRLKEDIPALAQFFVTKYTRLFHRAETPLSEKTIGKLIAHAWPGNVRELENVIKKIVALEDEEIATCDLSDRPFTSESTTRVSVACSLKAAARAASQQAERELILQALTRTHWNRKKAAEALQISYKALLYKLKQIELPDSEEEA
jgi:two-component system response regulator AtoC